uniref:Sulfatase N-terminal domain-containing protein n=1 Tax=Lotharella globosa TaxID=91324 RepID=A0A7S4DKW1_9EUKA
MPPTLLLAGTCAWAAAAAGPGAPATVSRPNILFILADDMGYGDVGYLQIGSDHGRLLTPNLDKLTKQGMRFTDAYAGAPVCAPSRCTLMTGRHSGHATVRSNGPILNTSDVTVANVLSDAGYDTALIGKWGLGDINTTGDPGAKGFNYFFGQTDQANCHNYYPSFMYRNQDNVTIPENVGASDATCGPDREKCKWSGDLWTEEAIKFLGKFAEGEKDPFFLYLSYTAPHAGSIGDDDEHGEPVPRISKGPYADKKDDWGKEQEYAAAVTEIDTQVGLVLAALESFNLDQNTLVLFASDNGASNEGGHSYMFFNSSGPLKGYKRSLHEGGHRTAFLARWPGVIEPGSLSTHQITFYDFLATAADLGHGKVPEGNDGMSFAPTLRGELQEGRPFVYHEYCAPTELYRGWGQAVRIGNLTAVCLGPQPGSAPGAGIPACKTPLVYDLGVDLHQDNDIADQHPDFVQQALKIMTEEHVPGEYCGKAVFGNVRVEVDPRNFEDPEDHAAFFGEEA